VRRLRLLPKADRDIEDAADGYAASIGGIANVVYTPLSAVAVSAPGKSMKPVMPGMAYENRNVSPTPLSVPVTLDMKGDSRPAGKPLAVSHCMVPILHLVRRPPSRVGTPNDSCREIESASFRGREGGVVYQAVGRAAHSREHDEQGRGRPDGRFRAAVAVCEDG
jgi:hypothetical protein